MAPACSPARRFVRRLASATLATAAVAACFVWRAEVRSKGALVLECPDDSLVVEVYAERPPEGAERLFGHDARPEWRSWGEPPAGTCAGRCVFHRQGERGRWVVRLTPGAYSVVTHRKSSCGFYGGDSCQAVEVKRGEELAMASPAR